MKIDVVPDSVVYLAASRGEGVPRPYSLRWLMPRLMKTDRQWAITTRALVVTLPLLAGLLGYQQAGTWAAALFGALLFAGLPRMVFWWRAPILTDVHCLWFTVLACVLPWPWNLLVIFIGASARESVPIWVALAMWSWWPLLGLVVPGALYYLARTNENNASPRIREALADPVGSATKAHKGAWTLPDMVWPWRSFVAVVFEPSLQLVLGVAAAYAQLLVANDGVRLYLMAAPVMLVVVCHLPEAAMIPLGVLTFLIPDRSRIP